MAVGPDTAVIVTGGASGIGAATSRELVTRGGAVVIADLDLAAATALAAELSAAGGSVMPIEVDVTRPEDAERAVDLAMGEFGGLHGAVNNAGYPSSGVPVAEESVELWNQVLAVNLSGVFYGMRAQIPAIVATGGGAVVNVSSVMGVVGTGGSAAYSASKHGVVGLTKVAALDYAAHGVRVNAVGPGYIETPMIATRFATEEQTAARRARHPLGRLGEATEVAQAIVFLLSDDASFMTGGFYPVDGGYTAQ